MSSSCLHTFKALLWLLLLLLPAMLISGQKSFANTQFDLPPDLPAEDPPPVIAANQDQTPATAAVPPPPPPTTTIAPQIVPIQTSQEPSSIATSLPPPPSSTTSPTPPSSASTSTAANNPKTPLPQLPSLVELPRFVDGGNVQPLTIPPALIESSVNTTASGTPSTFQTAPPSTAHQQAAQIQVPLAKLPPNLQNKQPIKGDQQIWFRDDINLKNCPQNAEAMAKHFKRKFPRNLLRHQKETVLAELLAVRLKECLRKERENHWSRMVKLLEKEEDGGDIEKIQERAECRAGLVQEQIACMNVHSYSCQFIQPTFLFRLLPTRIIVQEARLAEDGAEKCRKFSSGAGNRKLSRRGNSLKANN